MPVAHLTLEIRIEHAQSLKDRRQVVRSLKDQLKQSFNISVAEMDEAVLAVGDHRRRGHFAVPRLPPRPD